MRHCTSIYFVLTFLMAAIGLQAMAEAPWANIGASSARTYMSSGPGPGAEITLLAKRATVHDLSSLPFATVSEQGTVVAKTTMLYCYDSAGAELFTFDLGPNAAGGTQCGVIANGRIYAGAINTLYAFDLSGNEVSEIPVGDPRTDYSLGPIGVGPSGEIIVPTTVVGWYVSNAPPLFLSISSQGELNWSLEGGYFRTPAVSPDGRILTVAMTDWVNKLVCVDHAGSTLWNSSYMPEGDFPAVDGSRSLVLMRNNSYPNDSITALHLDSGGLAWQFNVDESRYHSPWQGTGVPAPLALDTERGQYYAVWEGGPQSYPTFSYLLTALNDSGELLWSKEWQSDRSKRYDPFGVVTIDSAGLLYLFHSYTNFKQMAVQGCVCCVEVLSPEGDLLAYRKFESPDATAERLWTGGQAVIGTDRRVYMFAKDYDVPATCSLYIFGPAGTELPADDQR
ncbi:MAG: PQQ-binding-like beta-propeller repeat protein, partial [Candidatus Coatesbacteria bacterium]|nr:PQQ-binding-like beta-propeller repeat protein [Candidatus Coatesbacteria bacterium]